MFGNIPSMRASDFEPTSDAPDAAYVGTDEDGLGLHRAMAADAPRWLAPGGALVLQMASWQWDRFATELAGLGYEPASDIDELGVARDRRRRLAGTLRAQRPPCRGHGACGTIRPSFERPFNTGTRPAATRREARSVAVTEFDLDRVDELIAKEEAALEPTHQASIEYRTVAERTTAGGVASSWQASPPHTVYVDRGLGNRLWDIDGNEYLDYHLGYGAMVMGHAHPKIVEAIQTPGGLGTHFAQPTTPARTRWARTWSSGSGCRCGGS